jgi:hypothetical protein
MKRWAVIVYCYGFVVSSAQAGEHWSAETCKRLEEMKANTYRANKEYPEQLMWMLIPILSHQKAKCGVNTQAENDAARSGAVAAVRARSHNAPAPRNPYTATQRQNPAAPRIASSEFSQAAC